MTASFIFFSVNLSRVVGPPTTTIHDKTARGFASSSGCEHMVTEPAYIDGAVLDLLVTDVPDLVRVRAGSPVGTSDHSDLFIDVVLEQPIPHVV